MTKTKLTKDQIQKLALSSIGFLVLVYVYFSMFLGPLNARRALMLKNISEFEQKLTTSKSEMLRATNLEREASTATARFAALKALSPEGAPIAWFPPRAKLFFANQHIDKATARLDSSSPFKQPEMAAWSRFNWIIDLPQTDFATLGAALAELENTEPLLLLNKISIRAIADDPEFQQVTLSATNAIVKR